MTGGSGFLGRYVVEQLVARGESVRVFSRSRPACLALEGVEWQQGDVQDRGAVGKACCDIKTVFHCAGLPGIWGKWSRFESINGQGTRNLVEAARDVGARRFVYTSSPSVVFDGTDMINGNESLPYPRRYLCAYPWSKAIGERAVLEANGRDGLATVALRPHLIWGPGDNHLFPRIIQRARQGRLWRVGDGQNVISTVYVENAAAAHLQAADLLDPDAAHAGKAYFINDPESINMWDWINQLLAIADLPPVTRSVSAATARRMGALLEWAWQLLRRTSDPPMTRFLAEQLACSHSFTIEAAIRDFGYRPIVHRDEGIRRLAADLTRHTATPDADYSASGFAAGTDG